MLKIGLTGGIGSGKSTVAKIFALLGVPVYDSDHRAKVLMTEDNAVRKGIIDLLGEESYTAAGTLDRAHISSRVFDDKEALAKLNAIVHPAVGRDFIAWCNGYSGQCYVLKEAALIFEAGIHASLDYIILVTAPEEIRIKRVVERDNTIARKSKGPDGLINGRMQRRPQCQTLS